MADKYEDFIVRIGADDVTAVADCVRDLKPKDLSFEQTRIIGFGSGTGLVGKRMHEHGFRKNIGVDAFVGMIAEGLKKDCCTLIQ